ncbi:hypothetical protein DFH11DRAFT_1747152 [Phellopilus nigrolimitatus]|nr:hypothetical protein DFH11DRAFT_1747152 [Phellopilus nigrolimitatus]
MLGFGGEIPGNTTAAARARAVCLSALPSAARGGQSPLAALAALRSAHTVRRAWRVKHKETRDVPAGGILAWTRADVGTGRVLRRVFRTCGDIPLCNRVPQRHWFTWIFRRVMRGSNRLEISTNIRHIDGGSVVNWIKHSVDIDIRDYIYFADICEALQVIEVENDGTGGGKERYSLVLMIEAEDKGSKTHKQAALFEVRVKTVKLGKQMCNIGAEMVQRGQTSISARFIFGLLSPIKTAASEFIEPKALNPPSPYARRTPLRTHPSDAPSTPLHAVWNFKKYISGKEDKVLTNMNRPENRKFSSPSTAEIRAETTSLNGQREPPGLKFGTFLTLKVEERLRPSMLAFCADIVKPLPELLPSEENPLQGNRRWYATLTLSIEFKTPLRLYDFDQQQSFSNDTDPLGRHNTYVEVWTAPRNRVQGEDWREKQQCLAIATQTAICVPYETQIVTMKVVVESFRDVPGQRCAMEAKMQFGNTLSQREAQSRAGAACCCLAYRSASSHRSHLLAA